MGRFSKMWGAGTGGAIVAALVAAFPEYSALISTAGAIVVPMVTTALAPANASK